MSIATAAVSSGPVTPEKHPGRTTAWTLVLGTGGTELAFNLAHALHHPGAQLDIWALILAGLYGVAPIAISLGMSHLATTRKAIWEVSGMVGIMVLTMAMSYGAIAAEIALVAPDSGWMRWLVGIVLDATTLMSFRSIVAPVYRAKKDTGRQATGGASGRATKGGTGKGANAATGTRGTVKAPAPSKPQAAPAVAAAAPGGQVPALASPAAGGPGAAVINLAAGSSVQQRMRAYWDEQVAAGTVPTGGDLNRECAPDKGPKYSLGKRYAQRWRAEPAAVAILAGGSAGPVPAPAGETDGGEPGDRLEWDEQLPAAVAAAGAQEGPR